MSTDATATSSEAPRRWQPLSLRQRRVFGVLIEKAKTTPDAYPMTLNGIVNACNQKSSREPLMSLDETTVARAIHSLQEKGLVWQRSESGNRVPKFGHRMENLLNTTAQELGALTV